MSPITGVVGRKTAAVDALRARFAKDPSIIGAVCGALRCTSATIYGYMAGDFLPSEGRLRRLEAYLGVNRK